MYYLQKRTLGFQNYSVNVTKEQNKMELRGRMTLKELGEKATFRTKHM